MIDYCPPDISDQVLLKNRQLYDETSGPVWQMAVYGPVHDGWEFINLGGKPILDLIAQRTRLDGDKEVLELCSGQGATCLYLASHYGCKVTGIEMNSRQIERARDRLKSIEPAVARRIDFIEKNVLRWHPSRPYHLIYSIDSMMLIEDLPALLKLAYRSLRPDCLLMIAVILGGARLDDWTRKFAWEVDGMISLPTASGYGEMLRAAGFREVRLEEITDLALDSSEKILAALEQNKERILSIEGEEVYRGWLEVGEIYLMAFKEEKLSYQFITARKAEG